MLLPKTLHFNLPKLLHSQLPLTHYQTFEENKVKEEYTVVFEYDKDGNLVSQKRTDKKGEIAYFFKFEYLAFDENKNWTKRLDYDSEEREEPKKIVIREYEYY